MPAVAFTGGKEKKRRARTKQELKLLKKTTNIYNPA